MNRSPVRVEGLVAFATAFAFVAAAELGDKTQLMTISLSSEHPSLPVAVGVIAGLTAVTAIGVAAGAALSSILPTRVMQVLAGGLFLAFGLWSLRRAPERTEDRRAVRNVWTTAASLAFLSELGDKTQFAVLALAGTLMAPWSVFAGATLGLAAVALTSVALGRALKRFVKRRWIRTASAALFLVAGALLLLGAAF